MKRVAILGSTGSIGESALKIMRQYKKEFSLEAVAVNNNLRGLRRQIRGFRPSKAVVVDDKINRGVLSSLGNGTTKILSGIQGLESIARDKNVDIVVIAISGAAALYPLLAAIKAGKHIALANKEALVMAGGIIMKKLKSSKAVLVPIDSEQSAIFQCLQGRPKSEIKSLYLTASGGALYDVRAKDFKYLTAKRVLKHPRWRMGKKITVDSATLMNKGLEVIEAKWLFDADISKIKVLIHKQAIIHSMVEFVDGAVLAQIGLTDMSLPIQYALSYPNRLINRNHYLDFEKIGSLDFAAVNRRKFPCLDLAYHAAKEAGEIPAVMSAVNEEAVSAFLDGKISFIKIPKIIEKIMAKHKPTPDPDLEDIIRADKQAREEARMLIA